MPYTDKFEDALVHAARLHRDQTRKGTGVPYVTHLLAVAAIVGDNGGTEEEVVAALLHDAPEDAGGETRLAEIQARFGDGVADIVAGCTDTYEDPKPPWRARKEAYLDHLAGAPAPVRLVSAADKLHNARSVLSDYRAPSGKTSGPASTAAGTAPSGTTGRSPTRWRGTARLRAS